MELILPFLPLTIIWMVGGNTNPVRPGPSALQYSRLDSGGSTQEALPVHNAVAQGDKHLVQQLHS